RNCPGLTRSNGARVIPGQLSRLRSPRRREIGLAIENLACTCLADDGIERPSGPLQRSSYKLMLERWRGSERIMGGSDHTLTLGEIDEEGMMSTKTLYERLGGYAISAVANDLLPRLRADPQLGRFWAHRAEDSIQREKQL